MLGDEGAAFYTFLQKLAKYEPFVRTISTLGEADFAQKGDEEFVLRFFAAKNFQDAFKGSIRDWLDDYMKSILLKRVEFNLSQEQKEFEELFDLIYDILGDTAFVKFRGSTPVGGLAPAYYEAVAIGSFLEREALRTKDKEQVKRKLIELVQTDGFRSVTGPGANSKPKLQKRIELVATCIREA